MARKPMKKFGTGKRYADAGPVTKAPEMSLNDIRLRRKTDDIQSDYMKAQARNAGNTAKLNIAKAKFEQRNADAKDDDAKRRGADRTATRKGEADAEAALTQARRTRGQSIADRDTAAAKATTATATATAAKPDYDKMSFAKAFAAARGVEGKPNFTWKGKSYNTNLASNKPATPARRRETPAPARAARKFGFFEAKSAENKPAAANTATPADKPGAAKTVKPLDLDTPEVTRLKRERAEYNRTHPGVGGYLGDIPNSMRLTAAQDRQKAADNTSKVRMERDKELVAASAAAAKLRKQRETSGERPGLFESIGNTFGLDAETIAQRKAKNAANAEMSTNKDINRRKKGGTIKKKPAAKKPMMKYAKGGSIDGCAIRGKTRAKRT